MIHLTVQQLSASLDGALTGPSLELVVRHLAVCHECRDRQARLAKHDDALRRLMGQEPSDIFLDDLTRRAEALATAIARGMPAPVMVTSVPLLHEEDPFAPVEPPPLPPRPEFGKSGQLALEAGWGRIGMKPTASAQAPPSDPAEARRMLESLASGSADDFTELTPEGPEPHTPVDGPVFDLPAWIKGQSGTLPRVTGPREVPRLEMFLEEHDEPAAGTTREAVNEPFRGDSEPGRPASGVRSHTPGSDDDAAPPAEPAPPEPSAYAPRGWTDDDAADEDAAPAHPGAGEYAPPGRDADYAPGDPAAYAPAGWQFAPAPPPAAYEPAWGAGVAHPGARETAAYPQAPASPLAEAHPDVYAPRATRSRRAPELDRVAVLALASVGALLLILLVLQIVPAGSRTPGRAGARGQAGGKPPRVEILRRGEQEPDPVAPKPHVRTADTPPPVEQLVPPAVMPVPADAPEHRGATSPVTDAAVVPSAASLPAATITTANTSHAPATHPAATAPPPASAHDAATATAPAGDEVERLLLCGQVTGDAGEPVPNALVSMAEIGFATRTDGRGRFCVSAPAGSHALLVESSGFVTQRVPVTFSSSSMDVHIRLQPAR
jgi:hypothetical protein